MSQLNLVGCEFGLLTVREFAGVNKHRNTMWLCSCSCGGAKTASCNHLRSGNVVSCGCQVGKHLITHGATVGSKITPEYRAWLNMRDRCASANHKKYKDYGGRGITVCDRWLTSFENFLADMGQRTSSQHSLDRIDNDGNYEPGNCRWATLSQQRRNQRRQYTRFE